MKTFRVAVDSLHVGQFYLSTRKLRGALDDFDPAGLRPFSVRTLDGEITLTDGHHTAFVAMLMGMDEVEVSYDTDDWDWDRWEVSTRECRHQGIFRLADLVGRVVTHEKYEELWCGYCDAVHDQFEAGEGQ